MPWPLALRVAALVPSPAPESYYASHFRNVWQKFGQRTEVFQKLGSNVVVTVIPVLLGKDGHVPYSTPFGYASGCNIVSMTVISKIRQQHCGTSSSISSEDCFSKINLATAANFRSKFLSEVTLFQHIWKAATNMKKLTWGQNKMH